MNSFKEWLSDYLRYFILALAMVLAVLIIIVGVRIYQNVQSPDQQQGDPSAVEILAETDTAKSTENSTGEAASERTEDGTENATDERTEDGTEKAADDTALVQNDAEETGKNEQTEIEAGTVTDTAEEEETEKVIVITKEDVTESNPSGGNSSGTKTPESAAPETKGSEADASAIMTPETSSSEKEPSQTNPAQTVSSQTEPPHTEPPQTEPPHTEPPQTEPPKPPEPVYMTVISACNFRSYADYGDNVIAWYPAGTVVEFLEDVGGWYKVQIDGMVGYMGAKFLQ